VKTPAEPSNKILIVLLFWEEDKAQAMKLARLLADLEPKHSDQADFLFVSRFDCAHDKQTELEVSRKFNVFSFTSKRRGVGWPIGCNSIFFGAMDWVYNKIAYGKVPHYKAVLFLGADSAPLKKDWLRQIHAAWDEANKHKKTYVAGALVPGVPGETHDHINGDCIMLSGNLKFLRWLAIGVQDIKFSAGWDWLLANDFCNRWGWADFPFIKSLWRKPSFSEQDWLEWTRQGVTWIHGIKNEDLLNISREKLL
jgi:hypothetical protein